MNTVFYIVQEYYSNPEVIVIVAENEEEACEMLGVLSEEEQQPFGHEKRIRHIWDRELRQIDLSEKDIFILRPPGNRDLR